MRFSEEEVYVIGVVFALLVSVVISIPSIRYMQKWYWSHPRKESYKEKISTMLLCLLMSVMYVYGMHMLFHYSSAILFVIIGSLLECLALYPIVNIANIRLMARYSGSFNEEEKKDPGRIHKLIVYYFLGFIYLMNLGLTIGGVALVRWAMPDVVEVRNVHRRASYAYDVDSYYVLPFYHGLKPGGSYIDNLSIDTIYRLVVTYGYSGEDKANHYAVKEQYPPHGLSKMQRGTVHVMDTIAPWMPHSSGRLGRYRTQRVYLTDYMHLNDFISVDMRKFGLSENKKVDAIEEKRNRVLRESPEKYRMYKSIDPYPYRRLIPDSLRTSNRSRVRANRRHND